MNLIWRRFHIFWHMIRSASDSSHLDNIILFVVNSAGLLNYVHHFDSETKAIHTVETFLLNSKRPRTFHLKRRRWPQICGGGGEIKTLCLLTILRRRISSTWSTLPTCWNRYERLSRQNTLENWRKGSFFTSKMPQNTTLWFQCLQCMALALCCLITDPILMIRLNQTIVSSPIGKALDRRSV